MGNQVSQTRLIISDDLHDKVLLFKILQDLSLSERLKNIDIFEVFTSLKEFLVDELKVILF